MDDPLFIQILTMIVKKHGCTIREWNIDQHMVDIDGPQDAQVACAVEISEVLREWAV